MCHQASFDNQRVSSWARLRRAQLLDHIIPSLFKRIRPRICTCIKKGEIRHIKSCWNIILTWKVQFVCIVVDFLQNLKWPIPSWLQLWFPLFWKAFLSEMYPTPISRFECHASSALVWFRCKVLFLFSIWAFTFSWSNFTNSAFLLPSKLPRSFTGKCIISKGVSGLKLKRF